jgi:hypothetical protein
VHDTQQSDLNKEMLSAIKDATDGFVTSVVNVPFGAGLAIIRVEDSDHPAITPGGATLPDGRPDTSLMEYPTITTSDVKFSAVKGKLNVLRMKAGRALRESGLKR